jgi:hypothetical protein
MPTVFPPVPRSSASLVDAVIEHLHGAPTLPWEPVSAPGLPRPWVGVRHHDLEPGRPWMWDVVTPDDHDAEPLLRRDPLTIPVPQDVVVVELRCRDLAFRVPITVEEVPSQISVSAQAVPAPPWELSIATGWTAARIAAALVAWSQVHVGRPIPPTPDGEPETELTDGDERYDLGDGLAIGGVAFDQLLMLSPDDAAAVTTAIAAVRDALA